MTGNTLKFRSLSSLAATVLIALAAATGCTMGPEPYRPSSVAEDEDAIRFVNDPTIDVAEAEVVQLGAWWRRFGDPVTVELVERALQQNTDLRQAAARVIEARATLASAKGQRLPTVDGQFSRDRRKSTFTLPEAGRVGVLTTTWDLDFAVNYQVDIWGKLARAEQAAWSELLATEADRVAALHTVVAEVIRTRVAIGTLHRRLDVAERNVESLQRTFDIVSARFERGVGEAASDVRLARRDLATAKADIPVLERDLAIARTALDVLLGRRPGTGAALPDELGDLPDLAPVPPGVPAALLDRRPDLKSAEFRAMAQQARIGVAVADMFPSLTLTASGGFTADDLTDLIDSDSIVYAFVANVAQKIFTGGQLEAEVDASVARAERLAADYAGQVLVAFKEVEDALIRQRYAVAQLDEIDVAVEEARGAEDLTRKRYEQGVDRLIVVLEIERRRRASEERQVLARQAVWNARIDLFLALGGDWELPTPTPTELVERHSDPALETVDEQTKWAPNIDRLVEP